MLYIKYGEINLRADLSSASLQIAAGGPVSGSRFIGRKKLYAHKLDDSAKIRMSVILSL
jgi:hypothetical protein